MDLRINIQRLPSPSNIKISYPRVKTNAIITWDEVRISEDNPLNGNIKMIGYNVYRGVSSNGIFYKQNKNPININRYDDMTLGNNPNVTYWYKVSTIYINNDDKVIEGQLSGPHMYKVNNTNKWFNKANERTLWILKNTGQLFDLYIRKYEGNKCSCYDSLRGRSSAVDCHLCFGTGIEGGYEPMFQLYVRLKPAETALEQINTGFQYNNMPGAWTISTVQIKNRDLLIGPDGIIYSVLGSHINQAAGYLFHQELRLRELDPTDALYKMKRVNLSPNL